MRTVLSILLLSLFGLNAKAQSTSPTSIPPDTVHVPTIISAPAAPVPFVQHLELLLGLDQHPSWKFGVLYRTSDADTGNANVRFGVLASGDFSGDGKEPSSNDYIDPPLSHWTIDRTTRDADFYLEAPVMFEVSSIIVGGSVGLRARTYQNWWHSDATYTWWHNDSDHETERAFTFGGLAGFRIGRVGILGSWNNFRGFGAGITLGLP
jgi:hypothetical protein